MTIVGIAFLIMAAMPTRENNVKAYNGVVDAWTGTYLPEFQTAAFTFYPNPPQLHQATPLTKSTSGDVLKDGSTSDFKSYAQLKFITSVQSSSITSGVSFVSTGGSSYFYYSFAKTADGSISDSGNGFPLKLTTALSRNQFSSNCIYTTNGCTKTRGTSSCNQPLCSSECAKHSGVWDSAASLCRFTGYLKQVCFLVQKADNGGWTMPASPSSNSSTLSIFKTGCYYESYNQYLGVSAYSPALYSTSPQISIDFEIRSVKDPYVEASKLTEGTYDFGLSQGGKAEIGLICLLIGAFLLGALALVFYCIFRIANAVVKNNSGSPVWAQQLIMPNYQSAPAGYAMNNQTRPPGGYQSQSPAYPPSNYPPQQQGYPAQEYPPQEYSQQQDQGYPSQGYPPPSQGYPPQYGIAKDTSKSTDNLL